MKRTVTFVLIGCFAALCNYGFSQCSCVDVRIIELKDTVTTSGQAAFTFKMTSDTSNCNSGYSDFYFVDQVGDTINQWTGSGMWMPNPADPVFDTAEYIIQLKPGYSRFPADFSGRLQVWNPECTIPFTLSSLTSNEGIDLDSDIQLFPNPTSDPVKVLNKSGFRITSLEIYDSDGKLIATENKSNDFMSINTLTPGMYFVKVCSEESVIAVKKLIKK